MLMFTCFLLDVVTPVLTTWWKPYYMGEKALPEFLRDNHRGGAGAESRVSG